MDMFPRGYLVRNPEDVSGKRKLDLGVDSCRRKTESQPRRPLPRDFGGDGASETLVIPGCARSEACISSNSSS